MRIHLEAYDPRWQLEFRSEKRRLEAILAGVTCEIEHIGSTSVEDLVAKPIIDILVGLKDGHPLDGIVRNMISAGYFYEPTYEDTLPERRFFFKAGSNGTSHNVHAVAFGSPFWVRHLAFRDYLRKNPGVAAEYAALKRDLATREWKDGNEYAQAKNAFIRKVEAQAGILH
jgi:GrpB-like predicted nucleotidyltransferase (UPF0157 family)